MNLIGLTRLLEKRIWRHLLFWACWVLGFTFIKSFGQSFQIYLGWLAYYVITLPIFVTHTYLVAYLLVPLFLNRRFLPMFILGFLALFYGFSVMELLLSNEFIFKWAPTGSVIEPDYLAPANVIRSGLGNLYIVLVFLAARTIRNWYKADHRQKELQEAALQRQMNEAVAKVQPAMLLYAIDQIEEMVDRGSYGVTQAIALTSEILSDAMIYHGQEKQLFSKEIELVRKLVELFTLFRGKRPDVEFFISGDPGQIRLPAMMLFSAMDMLFRKLEREPTIPEIVIEASEYAEMLTIQVLHVPSRRYEGMMEDCLHSIRQLESFYRNNADITMENDTSGYTLIIRNHSAPGVNTTHKPTGAVHST